MPQLVRAYLARAPSTLCAFLGVAALVAALGSLWPSAGIPPWPGATLALCALAASWLPGNVVPKALGGLAATLALFLGSLETAALWALPEILPL